MRIAGLEVVGVTKLSVDQQIPVLRGTDIYGLIEYASEIWEVYQEDQELALQQVRAVSEAFQAEGDFSKAVELLGVMEIMPEVAGLERELFLNWMEELSGEEILAEVARWEAGKTHNARHQAMVLASIYQYEKAEQAGDLITWMNKHAEEEFIPYVVDSIVGDMQPHMVGEVGKLITENFHDRRYQGRALMYLEHLPEGHIAGAVEWVKQLPLDQSPLTGDILASLVHRTTQNAPDRAVALLNEPGFLEGFVSGGEQEVAALFDHTLLRYINTVSHYDLANALLAAESIMDEKARAECIARLTAE